MEGPASSYVILRHPGMVWNMSDVRRIRTIVEHSRMFWIMVQGKEKWKTVDEV